MIRARLEERRRFPRINFNEQLRYKVRGNPKFGNFAAKNISLGGIGTLSEKFITPSTLLMLEVRLLSHIIHPVGKVVSSAVLPHTERNRLGIEFIEFQPGEQNFLKDYLNLRTGSL